VNQLLPLACLSPRTVEAIVAGPPAGPALDQGPHDPSLAATRLGRAAPPPGTELTLSGKANPRNSEQREPPGKEGVLAGWASLGLALRRKGAPTAQKTPVLSKRGSPGGLGGGESGIRTRDRLSPMHAFQACAFNHSATSPTRAGTYPRLLRGATHPKPSETMQPRVSSASNC
jgi:hypothetical protein